jgi:hypothetical protein
MKFREIVQGARARKLVEVVGLDGVTPIACAVRILMPEDDAAIEEAAVDFAKGHKVDDPRPGNSQYERGLMLHGLLRACLDPDVKERDEPYFDNVTQIGKYLDDARAAFLWFQQRAFQREISPNPGQRDTASFIRLLYESATERAKGGDPSAPFVLSPFGTLVSFSTEAARLLCSQLPPASPSGLPNPDDSKNSASTATPT